MWTAPLNVVRFGATTLWHLDAEERAPSTTSEADMVAPISVFRRTALIGLKVIEGPAHHGSVGTLRPDVDDDWECKGKRRARADL
jgi:hypothetical protein